MILKTRKSPSAITLSDFCSSTGKYRILSCTIKNKIEKALSSYILKIDKLYSLDKLSPILSKSIKDFLRRKSKKVRPILFVIGYLGFSKKTAPLLYKCALSIELLHNFMLVHDDIIDKSDQRRGKPSMHMMLNKELVTAHNAKTSGQDLAIAIGDIIYAMSLDVFLSIKENPARKEKALRKLISAALYTGSGEFIELIYGLKAIDDITRDDIYKIYDFKTANYTFASPLSIGATLAGATDSCVKKVFQAGILLGRAFQIKDDILGIFGNTKKTGKSNLTDLEEAKKTLLIWYSFHNSGNKGKSEIKRVFLKQTVTKEDLIKIREVIINSGSLKYANNQISRLINKAETLILSSSMSEKYKNLLINYSKELLQP